jgi:septal ring factor EnvC (AmiA/AmiB activator)
MQHPEGLVKLPAGTVIHYYGTADHGRDIVLGVESETAPEATNKAVKVYPIP